MKNSQISGHIVLVSDYPHLVSEWDYEKNEKKPSEYRAGSSKKVWWKCNKCGHSYEANIKNKVNGSGCPVCAGKKVVPGFNDLASHNKELADEWNYELNEDLRPDQFTEHSSRKVYWKCKKCGHAWKASIGSRTRGNGCPKCGRISTSKHQHLDAIKEYGSLQEKNEKLAAEWDYEKNTPLTPADITVTWGKKAYWICKECGYRWQATVNSRNNGIGCPACSGNVVVEGKNDLASSGAKFLDEWDYDKNGDLTPDMVTVKSNMKVWWKCRDCGYIWYATVCGRTGDNKGCPACGHRIIVPGNNDLMKKKPVIAAQWNYERNEGLTPDQVAPFTQKAVWWKCRKCGYEWKEKIVNRSSTNGSCPSCEMVKRSSLSEQILFYYVSSLFSDAINSYQPEWIGGSEIDIYIPSLQLGIEYDGVQWHKNIQRDIAKNRKLQRHGVLLLRIRENQCPAMPSEYPCIVLKQNDKQFRYMVDAVRQTVDYINTQFSLNVTILIDESVIGKDLPAIMSAYENNKNSRSVKAVHPEVLIDWDYDGNGSLSPEQVSFGSEKKISWKCHKCGYQWKAIPSVKAKTNGCPVCSGKRLWVDHNDLQTLNPQLAAQWDQDANGSVTPRDVTLRSTFRAVWRCEVCGNRWGTRVADRTQGSGCPYCAGKKAIRGKNDLATCCPDLLEEWDYEENDKLNLDPNELLPSSNKKAYWKCKTCGRVWRAAIYSRKDGHGCMRCSRKRK